MTADVILVLNAGSSSLKASVFEASPDLKQLAHGEVSEIGGPATFVWNDAVVAQFSAGLDHAAALGEVLAKINKEHATLQQLRVVGHRIVHGGDRFAGPTELTPEVLAYLESLTPLAPLHQPVNLQAVRAIAQRRPQSVQIGCFDTAFHASHAPVFQHFALPKFLRERGVRRYGFHGLSYEWIARALSRDHPQLARGRIVAAHLGNGASLCAMREGCSVDTTMGMTALDGLPMGTRCGAIDPGAILFMLRELRLDASRVEQILSSESGLLGLSGISRDVRELLAEGGPDASFALDYFSTMTAQQISRMAAAIGGLDGLVFTGGIGEHAALIRKQIVEILRFLTPFEVLVIAANEERMIAEHCWTHLAENAAKRKL